jgi:starch phosphorylase
MIRSHPERDWVPRVKIFGGKAAPSYHNAKLIIKLINDVAGCQQRSGGARSAQGGVPAELQCQPCRDDHAGGRPVGADLDRRHGSLRHRQHEVRANGALTIGTLDGANVEIKEHVGDDNIVIFGLTTEQVAEKRARSDHPRGGDRQFAALKEALDCDRVRRVLARRSERAIAT